MWWYTVGSTVMLLRSKAYDVRMADGTLSLTRTLATQAGLGTRPCTADGSGL
jgi:hypothetical protein